MKTEMTLREYINYLNTILHLPTTEKIQKKILKKFERTLKDDLQVWENAKKIKVQKTFAKVFPASVLDNAYKLNENYLSQILKLNSDEAQHQKQFNEWMSNTQTDIVSEEEFKKYKEIFQEQNELYNKHIRVSLEEQNNVMLKAIFEKFFTPLDVSRWEEDKNIVYHAELENNIETLNDLRYIQAKQNLNQENGKAYYQVKE
jgi:hypothetical protein